MTQAVEAARYKLLHPGIPDGLYERVEKGISVFSPILDIYLSSTLVADPVVAPNGNLSDL